MNLIVIIFNQIMKLNLFKIFRQKSIIVFLNRFFYKFFKSITISQFFLLNENKIIEITQNIMFIFDMKIPS